MEAIASTSKISIETLESNQEELKETKSEPGGTFACNFCGLKEHFDFKGSKPPFARQLLFLEECYIMKDPFSPLNKGETLVLGADCNFCQKSVCLDCSIFYTKRFCKNCALQNINQLPVQLHKRIKELSTDNDVN